MDFAQTAQDLSSLATVAWIALAEFLPRLVAALAVLILGYVAAGWAGHTVHRLLVLQMRAWSNTADFWETRWDLIEGGKRALEASGLTIPFPQREVHMADVPGAHAPHTRAA